MKVKMKEQYNNREFEVGYDCFYTEDAPDGEMIFWIDSPDEAVSLVLSKAQLQTFINSIQFLKDNVK